MFDTKEAVTYASIIPKKYRGSPWRCTDIVLTTFSLEDDSLENLLLNILGKRIKMIFADNENEKINFKAFYDWRQYHSTKERYLNFLDDVKKKNNFSFHPKMILLRYKNEENMTEINYVAVVSSKNITHFDSYETFAVAIGKESKTPNGETLAEFLANDLGYDELSGELEKIEFSTNDSDNFCFLTANDVFEKLKDNKPENLCIVSPFLNTKALKTLQNNGITISGVYTSDMNITNENEDEYKNFKDILYINKGLKKSNNETNNDNECESVPLVHAKIYCWQKDNMTHWIIGSSNATENGWYQKNSDNKFVGNSELNVYFTTKTEDYVKFKNQLEDDLFDPFIFETLKSDKKTKNRNELSDIMVSILNNLSVVECKKDETQYICKLEINIEKINERIKNDSDVKWEISALNGNVKIENNCLKSKEPFFSIMICVSKTDKSQTITRYIPLYNSWPIEIRQNHDKLILEELEYNTNKIEINIFRKSYSRLLKKSSTNSKEEKISKSGSNIQNKIRLFEAITIFCTANNNDKTKIREKIEFAKQFNQERSLYNELLKILPKEDEQIE